MQPLRPLMVLLAVTAACSAPPDRPSGEAPAHADAAGWSDPSPHRVQRVAVAADVSLEVLDWGGTGEPLVFLAGLGNTGHVYDDFAPPFADSFRVLAITRRGFGASSQPATGYDVGTRVADLLAVLDSLRLSKVNLVGHSIAGDELTGFAARHPGRVLRLVYLDAASDHTVIVKAARPPFPTMTAADSASPSALQAFSARLGRAVPEADLRATTLFSTAGRIEGDVTPSSVFGAIMKGLESPPYSRVRAPALAFYCFYESAEAALSPNWWAALDSAARRKAQESLRLMGDRARQERQRFLAAVPSGTVIDLSAANHFIWLSNHEEVVAAMRTFLGRADGR